MFLFEECCSHSNQAFRQLDQGRKGYLILPELLYAGEHSEELGLALVLPLSPSLIFMFDTKKAGYLTRKEFKTMLGHVKAVHRFAQQRHLRKLSNSNSNSNSNTPSSEAATTTSSPSSSSSSSSSSSATKRKNWLIARRNTIIANSGNPSFVKLDNNNNNNDNNEDIDNVEHGIRHSSQTKKSTKTRLAFDRFASTNQDSYLATTESDQNKLFVPMFTRYTTAADDPESGSSRTSRSNTDASSQSEPSVVSAPVTQEQEIQQYILQEPLSYLRQWLRTDDGREQFLSWLVRLVHFNHSPTISAQALKLLIDSLKIDGINISELGLKTLLTNRNDQSNTDLNELSEVDLVIASFSDKHNNDNNPGLLTQADFLKFADRIMAEYRSTSLQNSTKHKQIVDYQILETIGYGSEGVVKKARNIKNGSVRAIKILEKGNVAKMSKIDIQIKAMELLNHKNIVTLYQVLESKEHIFLVLEYCEKSVFDTITSKGSCLDEKTAQEYMYQLLVAIDYCHSKGVCHRDLRVENLLITDENVLKVADFGHAGVFAQGWDLFSTTLVGSIQYITPEQIEGKCYSGQSLDMWACGIICYFLLTAQLPFDAKAHADNMHEFLDDVLSTSFTFPDSVPTLAKDLISKLLVKDASSRLTCKQALEHPWLSESRNKYQTELKSEPVSSHIEEQQQQQQQQQQQKEQQKEQKEQQQQQQQQQLALTESSTSDSNVQPES